MATAKQKVQEKFPEAKATKDYLSGQIVITLGAETTDRNGRTFTVYNSGTNCPPIAWFNLALELRLL